MDIERALFLIVKSMKERNYRKAADMYIGIAVGNAAWPIGVTSVGIHERSAREKIGAQTQAHAMHDEETRKYLQSIKRLITFAQRAYPTVPSLSLDFNSGYNGWDKDALKAADEVLDIRAQVPALLALPANGDGWKSQDGDTRTWKSLLTHAYDGTEHAKGGKKVDMDKIRTMKDEIIARTRGCTTRGRGTSRAIPRRIRTIGEVKSIGKARTSPGDGDGNEWMRPKLRLFQYNT